MDITIFLAKLWGPVLIAVAMGVFFSAKYYKKIYRDLEDDALSVLTFGMLAMSAGIAQIIFHNTWNTASEIVVSFLGWGLLVKGALFIMAPNFVDQAGDWWVKQKLLPMAGVLTLAVGVYLSWIAYLSL